MKIKQKGTEALSTIVYLGMGSVCNSTHNHGKNFSSNMWSQFGIGWSKVEECHAVFYSRATTYPDLVGIS